MTNLTRKLGLFERAATRFDRDTPFNAAVSVTLRGTLDGASVRRALTAAVLNNPIMTLVPSRGSFVPAARGEPEFDELEGDDRVLARAADGLLNDCPRQRGGAPVRACLVHGDDSAALLICAPHYLVDAVSLAQLLFLTLAPVDAYGLRKPVTPLPESRFPKPFKGWRGGMAAARYAVRQAGEEIAARRDSAGATSIAIPKPGHTRHHAHTIPADELAKLSKACRQHHSTLNGALAAAVSRVFLQRLHHRDSGRVRLMSFCNLRRRVTPRLRDDELGAALAITRHLIRVRADEDWHNATAISRTIDASTKRGEHFCATLLAPTMMQIAFGTQAMRMADVAVSVPVLTWAKTTWASRILDFRGYVSVTRLAPPISVIAAVSRAGLSMNFMYLDSEFSDEEMAPLCEETRNLLAAMAA